MNRPATALFAALESFLVVGIGVGIPVVSLTLLWAFQYSLQVAWSVFWRAGADIWLVGHGVDLTVKLSSSAATATGIPGAGAPIVISIAALGFALTTLLLGVRAGRRLVELRHRQVGIAVAIAVFAALSAVVTVTAEAPLARVSVFEGVLWPTAWFAIPLLISAEAARRRRDEAPGPVAELLERLSEALPEVARAVLAAAVRLGASAAMMVFAAAGVAVAVLFATHYASIVTLYEGAHTGLVGGIAVTLGQLALVPNAIAWSASWFVGPGFALGAGSSISPLGTITGPIPAVPFLGALPTGELSFGFVAVLVPILAAFLGATLLRPLLERDLGRHDSLSMRLATAVAAGAVGGILIGLAAALSAGAAGPGRLTQVGPNGLVVGAIAALEIALPAALAMVVPQPAWSPASRVSEALGRRPREPKDVPSHRDDAAAARVHAVAQADDVVTERLDGFER